MSARYIQNTRVVRRQVAGEIMLVPINDDMVDMERIFVLNPTGDFIWQLLEQEKHRDDVLEQMLDEFDVDDVVAGRDIDEMLRQLAEAKLIEIIA